MVDSRITPGEMMNALRADYEAARSSRFRRRISGYNPSGSGADYHYRNEGDLLRIMEWARYVDRNDMVVGQGVDRLVNNIVQDGIRFSAMTGNPEANKVLEEKWAAWAEDAEACDAAGESTFTQILKMTLRAVIVDGDLFHLPLGYDSPRPGRLQAVEAHRCRTPTNTKRNVVNGVLLSELRERLEYWFTVDDIDLTRAVTRVADVRAYPKRDNAGALSVFHVYHPRRFSQTRGVSAFARIVNPVSMLDDIQFAKMLQQQVVSCFTIIRNRGIDYEGGSRAATGEQTSDSYADGGSRLIEGISPGMEIVGEKGETITGFSPAVPNETFFEHANLIMAIIAINLDLPLVAFLLDGTKTNFSGWRGCVDQARMGWKTLQTDVLADRVCRRTFEWKLRQWTDPSGPFFDPKLAAFAAAGADLGRHEWKPKGWPYIEPSKDAAGDGMIISQRLDSRRGVLSRRGVDIDDIDEAIVTDNVAFLRRCCTAAVELNREFPEAGLTWRDVAWLASPKPPGVAEKDGPEPEPAGGDSSDNQEKPAAGGK